MRQAVSLVVYPSPDHAGRSTATLVTWYVEDVELVVDEMASNGVTFEQYEGVLESGFDFGTDEKGISPRAGGGKATHSRHSLPSSQSARRHGPTKLLQLTQHRCIDVQDATDIWSRGSRMHDGMAGTRPSRALGGESPGIITAHACLAPARPIGAGLK
jgi:hypothetical protein